ncbi:uncharacterized protein LOC121377177 [Gigantopelta aegis]|uniref:uncharacterized protein LOC121377177 n=1 Tax=Gigantopelta aegis TaxID=1735272 RepID=UPI001B88CB84|nr:uncharacterized protein LOC121377177 [Gigantopelta aegis]
MDRFAINTMVDSFTSSDDLLAWAKQYGMENDEYVNLKLVELLCQEIKQSEEEAVVVEMGQSEEALETPPVPEVEDLWSPLTPEEYEELIKLCDEHWNPSYDELARICIDDGEWQPEEEPMVTSEEADDVKQGKGLPCSFCNATFRRMPDLMKHRIKCAQRPPSPLPSTSSEPPLKRQRTINQVGGIGPVAAATAPVTTETPSTPYAFTKKGTRTHKKTSAVDTTYDIKFDEQWKGKKLKDLHHDLHAMFEDVLKEATIDLQGSDLGRVIVHHDALNSPIVVPLQPLSELNADVILGHIEKVLQSNEDLPLDTSFSIQVGTIQIPRGGRSATNLTVLTGPNNSVHIKQSLVEIVNDDDLCMSRAIGVAWAKLNCISSTDWQDLVGGPYPKTPLIDLIMHHKKCPQSFYNKLTTKTRREQKTLALKLCALAGVPTDRPCNLNDIPAFEQVLGCQILVISAELGNKFLRVGDQTSQAPRLFLYFVEQPTPHFHAIVKITGFFSASYFCQHCLKPYNNKLDHSCSLTCIVCHSQNCPETEVQMSCRHCHVTCRSPECFQRHKQQKQDKKGRTIPSKCESFWKCTICKKMLDRSERDPKLHTCGEWKCPCCNNYVDQGHLCYQPPKEIKDAHTKLIFYDFECRQDELLQCQEGYLPSGVCLTCTGDNCSHQSRCQHCHQSWCGKQQHVPNYLVAQTACEVCKHEPVTETSKCHACGSRCPCCNKRDKKKNYLKEPCEQTCGFRQVIFRGDGAHIRFCQWLFQDDHKGVTAIAHNNKAYDAYFLLEYMIDQSMYPQKIIYNGSKIMYLQVERGLNIRIIDSLNFLPMKLAAFPKAFGLTELKKGYFPHYFNTLGNQNYRGPFPEPNMYGVNYMGSKERSTFLKWHTEQQGMFDFQKEMREYCVSDVAVLREACLKFQALMLEATGEKQIDLDTKAVTYINGIDPFAQYITIASVCMGIFQSKFLKKHQHVKLTDAQEITDWMTVREDGSIKVKPDLWLTEEELRDRGMTIVESETVPSPIAQVPSEGYIQKDQFSRVSIQWLEWVQHRNQDKYQIQHALNGGEHQVPGTHYRLDGFCAKTNTAFEFHGCLWHGCRHCFPHERSNTIHPRTSQSIEELYALTCRKREELKLKGYKVIEIWEHEFNHLQKSNPELKQFVNSLDLQDRLNPRDSFFGGRTNASTLHYKVKEGEEVKYVDFTSLYPWVNKYCQYPVGHPEIIHKDFKPLDQYFGIAKVKVAPPRKLYHPVLPYRSNGKLKFPLCRTCSDQELQTPCHHSDEERNITGTWCIPEILKAMEKGYQVITVYEVYHWPETTQYNPTTRDGGLFAEYINTFLKLKQEASGWPEWCLTDEDKDQYIRQYRDKEGVQLDKDKITKNPGLRSLAKLCLNSFWGKYGQRLNMKQSAFIHESNADVFFQMLADPTKEVIDFHVLTETILQLEYQHKSTFIPEDLKTNVFLATFTTSWARLKLYSVLEQLDENVLYYDTDSVIFVARPGDYQPPLGDYLGELTDEFVSGGGYRTNKGSEVCKVRGFSLNYANAQLINFEAIREIVLSPTRDATLTVTNPSKISREKRKRKIYNKVEEKRYKIVYTKRVIQDNLDTLPYGY